MVEVLMVLIMMIMMNVETASPPQPSSPLADANMIATQALSLLSSTLLTIVL